MSRIFVVEDEAVVSEDITQTLEHLGYEVAGTAESGMAAFLAIEKSCPDLVLMDIKLAGRLDGIQTTAALRRRWAVPIIYLTSHSDEHTLRRAKETAPHGYLLKPFNERDLRTAIEVALRKHELEQKLEQRERWFSTTLESVGDAVIATDPGEKITFMNPIAEELTGWKRGDAYGRSIHEVFKLASAAQEDAQAVVSRAIRDGFRAELPVGARLTARDGGSKEVDDSIAPIIEPSGNVLGSVVVFRDITEKRRLEERLTLAERLASIATMAAGMAHELNNPLAATVGNVEFAARRLAELAGEARSADLPSWLIQGLKDANDALCDAQTAGARVRRIVADLRKFSRAEEPTREALDLPDVLLAAFNAVHHLLRNSTNLSKRLGTTPLVDANEGQLVQVFTNLIANAIAASTDSNRQRVEVSTSTDELGRAIVEVKDFGHGIRPEHLPRIFEPFFTTRPAGEGLGLGLSICQTIVLGLGGEITVDSQPGFGATFRVFLPGAREPEKRTRRQSSMPAPARRARVLVIDDEEIVGRAIERLLSRIHEVHRETNPRQALSRLARGEAYDVILCDLTMPDVSGMDVYETILPANPELARRVVFLTGGVVSEKLHRFLESCSNLVLQKPFSSARLLAAIAGYTQ